MARRATTTRRTPAPAPPPAAPRRRRRRLLAVGLLAVGLLVVGGVAAVAWPRGHGAVLATVNGESIYRDDYRVRRAAEAWRLDHREASLKAAEAAGRLDPETAGIFLQFVANDRSSLDLDAMEALIDGRLQAQLAAGLGVAVSEAQVDEALVAEATTPEQRHVWVLGYRPAVDLTTGRSSPAEIAAARARAVQALADIGAGADWAEVARASDDDYAANGGDAGFLSSQSPRLDAPFMAAVTALPGPGITGVVEGDDGEFRIGRVTEIVPASVDADYQQKIRAAGLDLAAYRAVVRADLLAETLGTRVVDGLASDPAPQRRVSQIFIAAGSDPPVKVRHLLVAPKHDPAAAPSLPSDDPAWAEAEAAAQEAYRALAADPAGFATLADQQSDDPTRPVGGELPYRVRSDFDPAVADVVFGSDLVADQVLPPIRTATGWEVVQLLGRRAGAEARMAAVQTQALAPGADFAAIARANSDREAEAGGDLGWVARYQLDRFREAAIFGTPVGAVSQPFHLVDGLYLFKVVDEVVRPPDASQFTGLRANGFASWFADRRNEAAITRPYSTDPTSLSATD